jgi:dihydrofolate reductase
MKNIVYIATSIDGYIADKNGGIDWLDMVPNPEDSDLGYFDFIARIDALIMGRNSFETVLGFDVKWPYTKPVFVLSNTLTEIPKSHVDKAFLVNGSLVEVLKTIHGKGYPNLYIDGGVTVQNFLKEDLIDELIITTLPVVLGDGIPLFAKNNKALEFELVSSKVFLDQMVQRHYIRKQ